VFDDLAGQGPRVVGADEGDGLAGEGDVDDRFVSSPVADLRVMAESPGRLPDQAHPLALGLQLPPRAVAALVHPAPELLAGTRRGLVPVIHREERQSVGRAPKSLTQVLDVAILYGYQRWLARADPLLDERHGDVQELLI
jgi:hypothetical protein